jgi:O-antigen ligase
VGTAQPQTEPAIRDRASVTPRMPWLRGLHDERLERPLLILAMAAVPISIAVTESFLGIALLVRLFRILHGDVRLRVPRIFWYWLALAGVEVLVSLLSPPLRDGWGEIRHLLLVGSLFLTLPALSSRPACVTAWKAVFLSSAIGSLFLIGDFLARVIHYRQEIRAGADVSFYLRTGGLLNNWMVYGTVEIMIVAGFLSFWFAYPEQRRRWWPVLALNGAAVVLSLTRTVWGAVFLLLALELWRQRSRWWWALPVLPLAVYALAPGAVRSRLKVSMHPDYFSNAERIQMLRVGWRMVREHPWRGVGPGRVEKLYGSYLLPAEPVPKYHGHLHNNLAQLAAEFGLPTAFVALGFVMTLLRELLKAIRKVTAADERFLAHAGFACTLGFLIAGLFDYTYGHSLALIILSFAVLSPLMFTSGSVAPTRAEVEA